MRRIIDFSLMGEIALNLKEQIKELKNRRNQLLLDVNKIQEGYTGIDSTLIINKYKDKIRQIDTFIEIIGKYQICFEWLSGNYKKSHDKAESNLETILSDLKITDETIATIDLNDVGGNYND